MKKYLLMTALLCSASFTSIAGTTVSASKVVIGSPVAREKLSSVIKKPLAIASITAVICGHLHVVIYDDAIAGDFETAVECAVQYSCGGG